MNTNLVIFAFVGALFLFILLDVSRGKRFRGKRLLHPVLAILLQAAIVVLVLGTLLYWLAVVQNTK